MIDKENCNPFNSSIDINNLKNILSQIELMIKSNKGMHIQTYTTEVQFKDDLFKSEKLRKKKEDDLDGNT
jgi:hypothetical protein